MAAALVPLTDSKGGRLALAQSFDRAQAYARNSRAENTRRGYASDWRQFDAWCTAAALASLPAAPESVALYISHLAEKHRPATIGRHLAAIASAHKSAGYDSPASMQHRAVAAVWQGIRRTHGTAQTQKAPLLTPNLRNMVGSLTGRLIGIRDRALLLVGFAGAFRRSELVGLNCEDLDFTNDGLVVTLRRSKTDQDGHGRKVGLPYGSHPETCPVRSLRAWLEASGITSGPLFRNVNRHGQLHPDRLSGAAVALVVKRHAGAAGLDTTKYSGHSLRAGLVTAAAIAGTSDRAIMAQTGHKSMAMLGRYIRDANLFRQNAAATVGL